NRRRHVAVTGDENDRQLRPAGDALLQLQPVEIRQTHAEHEDAGCGLARVDEKLFGTGEDFRSPARLGNEPSQRLAHRDVVVDDEYRGSRDRCCARYGRQPPDWRQGGGGSHLFTTSVYYLCSTTASC